MVPSLRTASFRGFRLVLPFTVLAAALAAPAAAQPTNAEAYAALARDCMTALPDSVDAFTLDAPAAMPYLRTALVGPWRAEGRRVFVADSAAAARPRLAVRVERAAVDYERAGRRRVARTVTLALRVTLTGPDGDLWQERACPGVYQDVVPRAALARLEDPAFAETQGPVPEGGRLRRWVEPAVLTAAAAVTVYLFFTVRSDGE